MLTLSQPTIDAWAAAAAFSAFGALLVRRYMLHPGLQAWANAPGAVQFVLSGVAIFMALAGLSIVFGSHANSREAGAYTAVAVMSVVFVANLHRTGRTRRPA